MKKVTTYIILSLDVIFWILRILATYTNAIGVEFFIQPINNNIEITTIFVTLIALVLIAKRKVLGAIIYIIEYIGYFGVNLFNNIQSINAIGRMTDSYANVMFSLVGVALSIFTFLDILLEKNRENNVKDKKTDWFFKNKKYDMKKDERLDKNNYKTL